MYLHMTVIGSYTYAMLGCFQTQLYHICFALDMAHALK